MRYLSYFADRTLLDPQWNKAGWPSGMDHLRVNLRTLCREAVWLGRIPVFLDAAPLYEFHNFGVALSFPISRWLDTENIRVLHRADGGERTFPLSVISVSELQALNIPQQEILELPPEAPVTAEQNRRFRLIGRRVVTPGLWRVHRAPLLAEAFAHDSPPERDLDRAQEEKSLQVVIDSAPQARELAREVIRQLPRGYCAVHVRRGDFLRCPAFWKWTSPQAVLRALERAGIAADAPLYLMSNERNPVWLRRIEKKRPFLRYADFPRLAELTPPSGPIDNYFLYLIEQEILLNAEKKVLTGHSDFNAEAADALLAPSHVGASLEWEWSALYHPLEIDQSERRFKIWDWRNYVKRNGKALLAKLTLSFAVHALTLRLLHWGELKSYRARRKALGVP